MKETIINHFLDYEFVYIFLFCSIIFLLISIFIKRERIKKLVLLSFSIFFILFCFEFVLSFFMDKMNLDYYPDFYFESSDIPVQKTYEIKIKSKIDEKTIAERADDYDTSVYKKLYDVIYSQYDNGFRYTKRNENSTETYIFLGCSFVFGDCLNDDETLSYYFSKKFNFKKIY